MTDLSLFPMNRVRIEESDVFDSLNVFIVADQDRHKRQIHLVEPLAPLVVRTVVAGEHIERKPAFRLSHPSAQALMDGLWKHGIRPSSGLGAPADAALVTAMQAHIEDLRKVANLNQTPDQPQTSTHTF